MLNLINWQLLKENSIYEQMIIGLYIINVIKYINEVIKYFEKVFNDKYLQCKSDGSKYKKYLLVLYKDDNEIKYIDVPNESYVYKFNDIIKTYNVEEMISSCTNFDGYYE